MAQQTHGDWIKKILTLLQKNLPFMIFFLKIWLFFWMVIDWCSIRKKIAVGFVVNFERKLQFYSSIFVFIFYKKIFFSKIHNLEIFQNRKWCPYVTLTDLIYLKNQKIKLIFYKRALCYLLWNISFL